MSEDTVELNEVESFSYLLKCLWSADTSKRQVMNICDTILYKNGRPTRWLFTNGDGEVMKRKDENLNTQEIVRMFKSKSTGGAGVKDHRLKSKIATVWFVNTKNQIQSYLVDDLQLRSILGETLLEVLAVQLYIGGHNLKGSGVFEHRLFVRYNGTVVHKTHELVSMHGNDLTIYTPNVERLVVTESQHTALKQMARRVATRIETASKGQVANMVIQVVFTTAWVPILVSVRSVLLWHPDANITLYRNDSLYAVEPPLAPSHANPGSVLLPHERPSSRESFASSVGRSQTFNNRMMSTVGPATPVHFAEPAAAPKLVVRELTQEEQNEKELSDMFDVITGTEGSGLSSQLHSRLNNALTRAPNEEVSLAAEATQPKFGKPVVKDYEDADLYFKDANHQNQRFLNGEGKRPLGASAKGVHFPAAPVSATMGITARDRGVGAGAGSLHQAGLGANEGGKIDSQAGISRRGSALVFHVGKQKQDAADAYKFQSTAAVMPGERGLDKNSGAIFKNAVYGQTESSRTRLDFYQNQLKEIEEVPVHKILKNRRPISAPHGSANQSARGVGVESGGHGTSGGGRRGSGFTKKAPLMSGTVCFGDYCFLAEFEPVYTDADQNDGSRPAGEQSAIGVTSPPRDLRPASPFNTSPGGGGAGGGLPAGEEKLNTIEGSVFGNEKSSTAYAVLEATHRTDGGSPPAKSAKLLNGESTLSEHDLKPAIMKFQLPFRSVLTMRSEEDYLKTKLYEDWAGDAEVAQAVRNQNNSSHTFSIPGHEKKLLDITLRHLRRVGYCCLNDVRRTVMPLPAPHESGSGFSSQWKALSRSYRKHIYVDALSKTHPSRFYQTVPVCDTCQFIYSMADQHREELVMGHPQPAAAKTSSANKFKPRVTSTGIHDAQEKGRARRLAAETTGQERQAPHKSPQYNNYADPADPRARRSSSAGYRGGRSKKAPAETHDCYDEMFDQTYIETYDGLNNTYMDGDGFEYELPYETYDGEGGSAQDAESKLARRLKAETAHARDGTHSRAVQIGISTEGGAISSWVRVLTEPENTPLEPISEARIDSTRRSELKRPQSAGPTSTSTARKQSSALTSQEGDDGKPNPMGPLAGQGIGGPLGQYRGYAAPLGNMLGHSSGDVGSTCIDSKGNFLHPKKRSPADRGTGTGTGTSGEATFSRENKETDSDNDFYEAGEGIAYAKAAEEGPKHDSVETHFLSNSADTSKKSFRSSKNQGKPAVRPSTAGATRARSKDSSKSPVYESAESYKVGYPNRSGPKPNPRAPPARPHSASAVSRTTAAAEHLQNHLESVQIRREDTSGAPAQDNLMNIQAYSFNATASTRQNTVSAMDLHLYSGDLSTSMGRKTGNTATIDEFRFDATAPYFPIDGIIVTADTGNTRSGDYKNFPAAPQESQRIEFAQYVPQQAVYKSSGAGSSFEKMLLSSVRRLEAQATGLKADKIRRPKSASSIGVSVGSKERVRRSQELRRLSLEREEEEARRVGYLGGMSMGAAVRDLSALYST